MAEKARFLLVNPYIRDFAAYNLWLRPLGLVGLFNFLKANSLDADYVDVLFPTREEAAEYRLRWPEEENYHTGKFPEIIIEKPAVYGKLKKYYRQFGIPREAFIKRLMSFPAPSCILMSSGMTYWYPGVIETIRICREVFPEALVILGGIYATLCYEHAKLYSGADFVLKGSWIEVLPGLLADKFAVELNAAGAVRADSAFREKEIYPDSGFGVVRAGDGCSFNCSYCASGILSGVRRKYPVPEVFAEIREKAETGCVDIAFYDDALLEGAENSIIPLLEKIASQGPCGCRFHTPNGLHARYMTERIAKLFKACNFKTIRLSFDRDGASRPGDKAGEGHLASAARALSGAGYRLSDIEVYTLIGLNGQDDGSILDSYKIISSSGMKITPAQYSPVPGTSAFNDDLTKIPRLADEPLLHNSSAAALWGFDLERCERLKKTALAPDSL